jgi:hypothetical protein
MKAAIFLLAIALVACEKQQSAKHIPREQAVKLAREAAQDAFGNLSSELSKAMSDSGPVAAISVCSEKAGRLVAEVATRRNIDLMRLSDRPRNPLHAAQGADLATLETFRSALQKVSAPEPAVEELPDGRTRVRLPITISQPLCLQCHGPDETIAPDTREAIRKLYPADRATGYQLNDLRGIWQVTLSPEPAP